MYFIYRVPACGSWILLGYTSTREQAESIGEAETEHSLDGFRVEYRGGEPEDYGDGVSCLDE